MTPTKRNYYRNQLILQFIVCALCGKKFEHKDDITIDHIVPLSKGGKNNIENLQLAHQPCNLAKGNKPMSCWDLI